jgi:hypothetical protein
MPSSWAPPASTMSLPRLCDKAIENLARKQYPETARLRQISGVGAVTALHFVLTIGDPSRFETFPRCGCVSRTDATSSPIRRHRPATENQQSWQQASPIPPRSVRTIPDGTLRARYRPQAVGNANGPTRRQKRKEACHCCGGSQTRRPLAPALDYRRCLPSPLQHRDRLCWIMTFLCVYRPGFTRTEESSHIPCSR